MTPTADELLRDAEVRFDRAIIELAIEEGNRLVAAGALADDLPRLMAPFVAAVRQWRADAMAEMHAHAGRIRLIEARIRLYRELIRRNDACMASLERHGALICPGSRAS
jgi:hypothetical protein